MASTAELTNNPKEPEAKRQDNASSPAASQQVNEPDSSPLNHAFTGAPGEQPTESATRMLKNPALAHLANKGTRAVALMRAQQARGNRFTRGVVANMQRKLESGADVKQAAEPIAKDTGCAG